MSDYSAVAPPQNFQSSAFAAALQRAKQIAAKINPGGQKRSLEDGNEPEPKKGPGGHSVDLGAPVGIGGGGGSSGGGGGGGPSVGGRGGPQPHGGSNTGPIGGNPPGGNMGGPPGLGGGVVSEDIKVPDKMVGLIIGRGGEQITRLQSESGCKIQMAPDSQGQSDRICSLAGTREAINRAKELIMNIVHQRGRTEGYGNMDMGGGGPPGSGGPGGGGGGNMTHVEIMVPGPKVGLIIGKGGETIKQLQEKSGAKMVVIQDGPNQEQEKPLRISGEASKVEYAKQLVYDLIAEKEMQAFNRGGGGGGRGGRQGGDDRNHMGGGGYDGGYGGGGGGGGSNYGGGGNGDGIEVSVPRAAVGVVIGKGGDMIKKIQAETGARIQFQQVRDEIPGDRMCLLTGKPQHVDMARQRIEELIDSVIRRDNGEGSGNGGGRNNRGGRGGGGGDRGDRGGYNNDRGGNMGHGGHRNGQDYNNSGWGDQRQEQQMEVTFVVPSNKCGVVIGKGGETIKQINQQSGAHCELDRRATGATPGSDKTFVIRGTAEQVDNCKRIISDKVQMLLNFVCTSGTGMPQTASYPGMAPQGYNPQGWAAPGYQQPWQAPAQQQESAGAMNVPNQVQINPSTGQPDYSLQWAEYYRSLGMHREAEMIEQQAKTKAAGAPLAGMGPAGTAGAPPQTQSVAGATLPTPTQSAAPGAQNGAAGQPDYSVQWAEYYRSIGKIKEAEAIESQMKNKGGSSSSGGAPASVLAAGGAQGAAQPGAQYQPQGAYGAYQAGYYPGGGAGGQQAGGAGQGGPQGQYNFPAYGFGQPAAQPDN